MEEQVGGGWEAIIYFKYLDTVSVYLECKQIKIFLRDDFIVNVRSLWKIFSEKFKIKLLQDLNRMQGWYN